MHSLPGLTVSREIIAFSCFARFAFDIILWKIILASPGTFVQVKLLLSATCSFISYYF